VISDGDDGKLLHIKHHLEYFVEGGTALAAHFSLGLCQANDCMAIIAIACHSFQHCDFFLPV
jgi:hypothetical protein